MVKITPDEVIKKLLDGNKRFVEMNYKSGKKDKELRESLVGGQDPIAIILSCSDSRVHPSVIFDKGLGELFTVRVAGNILDETVIGSIEYAILNTNASLIVVLGHQNCGAVSAAISGGEALGCISKITEYIKPAVESVSGKEGDLSCNVAEENVKNVVKSLQKLEPIIASRQKDGSIKVVGAYYSLETGEIHLVD